MKVEWVCENCGKRLGNIRPVKCPKCGSPAFRSIYLHVVEEKE